MPTYLGWNVITMPAKPAAPQTIEFSVVDIVAQSTSPFTGQQQIQNWGASYMEAIVSLPPLTDAQAQAWVSFLFALQGIANVFQFNSAFVAAYPLSLNNNGSPPVPRYWRLKSNQRKWSVSEARLYGIQFEIREAI